MKPVVLIIMDGFGLEKKEKGNAVELANKPNFTNLWNKYPHNTLQASGEAVGLPEGQMGNSEVGHLNIGAGRVVYQSLTRINVSIKDKSFFQNESFLKAINHVKKYNSKLHILGLCSNGGVHSHTNHIKALYNLAKMHNLEDKTYLHAFTDGRDTPTDSGLSYLKDLENYNIKIATVSGRYYAMDRDNNWDRLNKAYDAMVLGIGNKFKKASIGLEESYNNKVYDEFIEPFIVNENGLINDNDAIIFANFRPDRAIRIATALSNPNETNKYYTEGKTEFNKSKLLKNILFVSMMHYSDSVKGLVAFPLQKLENLYGDVISKHNLNQLRIAETEKYAHVTFFFDGGVDKELKNSKRILVNSPKVATYDLKPEMSIYEVTEKVLEELDKNYLDTVILNFANCDMVGHTGNIKAAIKAVEATDTCLGKVVNKVLEKNGVCLITADHGNAEKMLDESGNPYTAHTTNLVPIIITLDNIKIRDNGVLADLAPTMLELLNIEKPTEMTGMSLIEKVN